MIISNREKEVLKTCGSYKTSCCNNNWQRKGIMDFRCNKCNKDITMDIMFQNSEDVFLEQLDREHDKNMIDKEKEQ